MAKVQNVQAIIEGGKTSRASVTFMYSTDRENEVRKIFIISTVCLTGLGAISKPTLNFSGLYRRVQPAKLTNHSAHTNLEI